MKRALKRKTKAQRQLIREHGMMSWLWVVINDRKEGLLVMNWLTGEFRWLGK